MTLLLQSFDSFDVLAEFDPASGAIKWRSKKEPGLKSARTSGHIAKMAGGLWFLYRTPDGTLHVRFNSRGFALKENSCIDLARGASENILSVVDNGTPIFSLRYPAPKPDPPLELDPTPFVEEEDFDFGLFLHNVTRELARRQRIYTDL